MILLSGIQSWWPLFSPKSALERVQILIRSGQIDRVFEVIGYSPSPRYSTMNSLSLTVKLTALVSPLTVPIHIATSWTVF